MKAMLKGNSLEYDLGHSQLAYFNDISCGGIVGHFESDGNVFVIDVLTVLAAYRNWGVGTMLTDWSKEKSAKISIVVPIEYAGWFAKRGFTECASKDSWFGIGIECTFEKADQ